MSSEEPDDTPGAQLLPDEELNLTDPKAMRALAHPVRMALLELLGVTGTITATQASEVLGESPANCAFHLRTLAKYGYVEEAGGGPGRQRPWRLTHRSLSIESRRDDEPQTRMAAEALAAAYLERWLDRIRRAFSARDWNEEWDRAASVSNSTRFLTITEAAEVAAQIRNVLDSYRDRTEDATLRPEGARPVDFAVFSYPLTDPADGGQSQDIS
jgi:predicted ArsR family transcriptional regulator